MCGSGGAPSPWAQDSRGRAPKEAGPPEERRSSRASPRFQRREGARTQSLSRPVTLFDSLPSGSSPADTECVTHPPRNDVRLKAHGGPDRRTPPDDNNTGHAAAGVEARVARVAVHLRVCGLTALFDEWALVAQTRLPGERGARREAPRADRLGSAAGDFVCVHGARPRGDGERRNAQGVWGGGVVVECNVCGRTRAHVGRRTGALGEGRREGDKATLDEVDAGAPR
jgi:hypothetical protein